MSVYAPLPMLAPHKVIFVSADGTSIRPIAQAKSKEPTLPPPSSSSSVHFMALP